ncbi:transmembrane protein, putative [Medicago truncatula]|uniref:Transmembrane protein, putative n=1 Tax=Medicago truncatula TaxID=3880 RepID=A0A072UGE0_MEDTR|nr:transmembrane protein, putative [Medicago truncatula]
MATSGGVEQSQGVIYSLFSLLFRNLLLKLPRIQKSVYSIPSRISWPNISPKGLGLMVFG